MLKVYGIDHKTSDIKLREKYYIEDLNKTLTEFKQKNFIPLVILSTCNRTEYYFEEGKNFFNNECFWELFGIDAVRHLFRLSCGLESQILGETEILRQIKHSYLKSVELNMTNKFFNKIFHSAIRLGKYVRTHTNISKGNISFASIIFNISKDFFVDIRDKKIFILGTGEIATKTLKYLCSLVEKIYLVSSKHYDRSLKISNKFDNVSAISFFEFKSLISLADIIIVATSAPHFLIDKKDFLTVKKRILIFDISVPRNVNENVKNTYIQLYSLDDLKKISDKAIEVRKKSVSLVEEIIENEIYRFKTN